MTSIILLVFGGILFFTLLFGAVIIFKNRKREFIVKNFESYMALLQYNMDKAYEMVHKDQVLTYSIEATTVPESEIKKANIDFMELVIKLIGPNMVKELTVVFGSYDSFLLNLSEYFNTRYDNDEIRKSAMNEMMEDESQLGENYYDVG